ncbi:MAG: hypothetical protein K2M19_03965 [Muribaculaceae bacterium]|nr:hypothetical protein [Muribaculaceae bacterium]
MDDIRILIVIVIYKQAVGESRSYNLFNSLKQDILIIDNSPESGNKTAINSVDYISFPDNPGLSKAYNVAAEYAKKNGYDWILLADQDTRFDDDIIDKLKKASRRHPDIKLFCPFIVAGDKLMSPVPLNNYFTKLENIGFIEETWLDIRKTAIINSGMFINVNAFLKAGGYNEDVFLDYSDFNFLVRFGKLYNKAICIDSVAHQEFSNQVQTISQKLNRFKLFCQSVRHFESRTFFDKTMINALVIKRLASLIFHCKSTRPLSIYLKNYIL